MRTNHIIFLWSTFEKEKKTFLNWWFVHFDKKVKIWKTVLVCNCKYVTYLTTGIHFVFWSCLHGFNRHDRICFCGRLRCWHPCFFQCRSSHLKNLIWIPCLPQVAVQWLQEDHSNSVERKLLIFNLEAEEEQEKEEHSPLKLDKYSAITI